MKGTHELPKLIRLRQTLVVFDKGGDHEIEVSLPKMQRIHWRDSDIIGAQMGGQHGFLLQEIARVEDYVGIIGGPTLARRPARPRYFYRDRSKRHGMCAIYERLEPKSSNFQVCHLP